MLTVKPPSTLSSIKVNRLPGKIDSQDRAMHGDVVFEIISAAAVFIILIQSLITAHKADVLKRLPIEQGSRLPGKVGADPETAHITAYR